MTPATTTAVADAPARPRARRTSTPTAHIFSAEAGARPVSGFFRFAAIPVFAFGAVVLIPFLVGVILSFTDWNGIDKVTSFDYSFVGAQNYGDALGDSSYRSTVTRTLTYVVSVVVISNLIAFGLALLVTSKLRAQNFFRALFFTPNLIGGVILGFIWVFVFNEMLPWLGDKLGIGLIKTSWLVEPTKALITLIVVAVWQLSGYLMLIYIAGLVSIPEDVIEASRVDGATGWQQLRFVKVPLMVPAFTVSLFLALRNAFLVFDVNLALTEGGPFRSTELITLNVYLEAFRFQNFQTAQSKAVILFLMIAAIAAAQVAISRRFEVTE